MLKSAAEWGQFSSQWKLLSPSLVLVSSFLHGSRECRECRDRREWSRRTAFPGFGHCRASVVGSVEASDWWVMGEGWASVENQEDMADLALVKAPSND